MPIFEPPLELETDEAFLLCMEECLVGPSELGGELTVKVGAGALVVSNWGFY